MSAVLLFNFLGGGNGAVDSTGGGWLTAEQAAAQLRELKRRDREEDDRRAKVKKKARELEETIAEAYQEAMGRPRLKKALEGVETPAEFTPESIYDVGTEIAEKMAKALEGTGRRFSQDRARLEELNRALDEFARLLNAKDLARKRAIAEMLLLAVV